MNYQQGQPLYLSTSPTPVQQNQVYSSPSPTPLQQPQVFFVNNGASPQLPIMNEQQQIPQQFYMNNNAVVTQQQQLMTNPQQFIHTPQVPMQRNSLLVTNNPMINNNNNNTLVVVGVNANGIPILQAMNGNTMVAPTAVNYIQPSTISSNSTSSFIQPVDSSSSIASIAPQPKTTENMPEQQEVKEKEDSATGVPVSQAATASAKCFLWGLVFSIIGIVFPFSLCVAWFIFLAGSMGICSKNKKAIPFGIVNLVCYFIISAAIITEICIIIGALVGNFP